MNEILYKMLIGLGIIVFAPIIGGFLTGIDRKITAHMQSRIGPPIVQPFYDVIKLFGKERFAVNNMQDICLIIYLLFTIASAVMLFTGQDLLIFVFVLAIGDVALIMGAMSARSPYSRIGAQREIIQMMICEPVIIFLAIGAYLVDGSFLGEYIYHSDKHLIYSLPLMFIALLVILTVKLRKSPFDYSTSHEAHQELVRGLTIEFSGYQLGLINIAEWFEVIIYLGLVVLFFAQPIWVGILIALAAFLFEILIDNICARVNWSWMLKVVGSAGIGLSIANLAWLYLK